MKKYSKQLGILLAQGAVFYLFPPLSRPVGPMVAVLGMLLATLTLAYGMGGTAGKGKWLYPALTAALFLPSVFLYYNASALIQAAWYFMAALLGVTLGALGSRR